jgi:NAD(P)-dependent dehydrogenase (short-subunit alcohol dehydrogenase family)
MPLVNASGIKNWTPDRLPDLAGKLYVITGGNSGIGLEAAKLLAARNASIVVAARNLEKGTQAVAEIKLCGPGKIDLLELDLADLSSIRAAADEAKQRFGAITGLINNAGIMQTPRQQTADGFEMQFGTNHLGHFLWTALMFERVDPFAGRVVTVSSIAHKFGRIRFNNLMFDGLYDPSAAYTQSKLANLVFALELDRRLSAADSRIASVACHPGYSNTSLQSTGPGALLSTVYTVTNALMAQPAELGAVPTVLAAAGEEAVSGGYYGPTGLFDARGPVGDAWVEGRALNTDTGERLWQVSEELVGQEFSL